MKQFSKNRKAKLFLVTLISIFAVLELINIHLSNSVSTNSIYASKMQKEVELLSERNSHLKAEVLALSSYESVASRAALLGFGQSKKNTISLSGPTSFAKR